MDIIYDDSDLIVVEKAAGEVVHPSPGHESGALSDLLKVKYPEIAAVGSRERPGVVHRLDMDTSGVMVFARTQSSYLKLRREFESHRNVEKTYLAVCHGSPSKSHGVMEGLIGRERLYAITKWQVLAKKNGVSLVEFNIKTGRMHQIRIHAAGLGCPIVGDRLYGSRERDQRLRIRPCRTLLHSARLAFIHPTSGCRVEFVSTPPFDIVHAV